MTRNCRNILGKRKSVNKQNHICSKFHIQVEKKTFAEEVNEAFREAARGSSKVRLGPSTHLWDSLCG